ncbi:MAG: thymidylate synthase [Halobacteriota archaeon]
MMAITALTLPDAWYKTVRHIMEYGDVVNTEYGIKARQILLGAIQIDSPKEGWHKGDAFCTKARIEEYKKQFDRAYLHQHAFEYTYLERLVEGHGIDQLEWMREQLAAKRTDSKRIQAITWIPKIDCFKEENQPCFQRMWVYAHPNNRLDVHIMYRSWDIFQAYEANINAFLSLIKKELLAPTGLKMGTLCTVGNSMHIYEYNWEEAQRVIDKYKK